MRSGRSLAVVLANSTAHILAFAAGMMVAGAVLAGESLQRNGERPLLLAQWGGAFPSVPPEQRQQMRQQMREHWQQMPPEQREERRQMARERWQQMPDEERQRIREEMRERGGNWEGRPGGLGEGRHRGFGERR